MEWEQPKVRQERGSTGSSRKASVRTSLFYARDRKLLLAWHSGMNKYINSYVDGRKMTVIECVRTRPKWNPQDPGSSLFVGPYCRVLRATTTSYLAMARSYSTCSE